MRTDGGRLPGGAALAAVHADNILGVLVLTSQIGIGQADVCFDIQRVIGIHILQCVVSLDQEDIYLVIIGGGVLIQQGLIQLVLVVVVLVGVDGPLDDGAVVQGGGGLIGRDLLDLGVIIVETALELIVPAPDVQDLAAGGKSLGSSRGRSGSSTGSGSRAGRRTATCSQGSRNGNSAGSEQEITTRDLFHKSKPPSTVSYGLDSIF